jgi:hypothetical protein
MLQFGRLHTLQVGVGSPEIHRRAAALKERPFFRASIALRHLFMVARAGEPSGSPVPVFRSSNLALGCHLRLEAKLAVLNRNTGAFTMAVQSIDASASQSPASNSQRPLFRIVGSSRTRRNHGAFLIGSELATVYSSRRTCEGRGVTVSVGNGQSLLSGGMSPHQARALATALMAAAAAVDAQGGAA